MYSNFELEHKLIEFFRIKQYLNTTVYTNNELFVLSPYVGNKYNWFDIREVNLKRFDLSYNKGLLIIRHSLHGYIGCDLSAFCNTMVNNSFSVTTEHSGKHWKYFVEPSKDKTFIISNQHNKNAIFDASLLNIDLKRN